MDDNDVEEFEGDFLKNGKFLNQGNYIPNDYDDDLDDEDDDDDEWMCGGFISS